MTLDYVSKKLSELKNQTFPYQVKVADMVFDIHDANVYAPSSYAESLVAFLKDFLVPGQRVLDIGCGSGLISIASAKFGCHATGIDIVESAIWHSKHNARRNEVEENTTFIQSDGFKNLPKAQKFDVIITLLPQDNCNPKGDLERSFYDPDYRLLKSIAEHGASYLTKDGQIILGLMAHPIAANPLEALFPNATISQIHNLKNIGLYKILF